MSSSPDALSPLQVLVVDVQATAACASGGSVVEIGWAPFAAADGGVPRTDAVEAHIVAPPPGAALPRAVARITGLSGQDWERGETERQVVERLLRAARGLARPPSPPPLVAHYARFEEPFLRALHARHGAGPFPFELLCTHEVARRLLPELPRRGLRALAGYFGAGVSALRRAADHVAATAFVWASLVALLSEREGIARLDELQAWLAQPVRRAPRRFPLPRERRLALPRRPGVYRLERASGDVLYVGKAASLRQRVSGHFQARSGRDERALEMLTQVRELSWCETETALEAALLEADEIKRLRPPYNVALAATSRSLFFARRDLGDLRPRPDRVHGVGPLAAAAPFEAVEALRAAAAAQGPPALAVRARALGVDAGWAPDADCFAAGQERFLADHGRGLAARSLLSLGCRLWAERRAELALEAELRPDEDAAPDGGARSRPGWDPERVALALEEMVLRAAHAVRRARWLVRLSESCLAWREPESSRRRLLVIRGGSIVDRATLEPDASVPVPPGHAAPVAERLAAFDLASFDRLRVLTTELRGLAARGASIELRLGRSVRLRDGRLRAVLAAV